MKNKVQNSIGVITFIITIINIIVFIKVFSYYHYRNQLLFVSIFYNLVLIIIVRIRIDYNNIANLIIIMIGIVRYNILIWQLVLNQNQFIQRSNLTSVTYSDIRVVYIMIIEIIGILMAIIISKKYMKKSKVQMQNYMLLGNKKLYYGIIVIFFSLYFIIPGMNDYYSFIVPKIIEGNDASNLIFIANQLLMICRVGVIGIIAINIKNKGGKKATIIKGLVYVILISSIYRGGNRGYLLMNYLSVIIILVNIFHKRKKIIVYPMVISVMTILISITLIRTFDVDNIRKIDISENKNNISEIQQSYLAGPDNILISIKATETIEIMDRIGIIFNDIIFPVPIIGKQFRNNSSVMKFNERFYNHQKFQDQIVPLSGEGYIWMGYLGSFLLVLIVSIIAIKLYYKFMETNILEEKYLYVFLSIWFSLGAIYNLMILSQAVIHHASGIIIWIYILRKTKKKIGLKALK